VCVCVCVNVVVSGSHRRHTTRPVQRRIRRMLVETESKSRYQLVGPLRGTSTRSPRRFTLYSSFLFVSQRSQTYVV